MVRRPPALTLFPFSTLSRSGGDAGEPMAQLRVRASKLRGVEVPPERAPSMIDEYLVLAVAARFSESTTIIRGLQELRVKETARPGGTAAPLRGNGRKGGNAGKHINVRGKGHVPARRPLPHPQGHSLPAFAPVTGA